MDSSMGVDLRAITSDIVAGFALFSGSWSGKKGDI
jgi:hypothetical protein